MSMAEFLDAQCDLCPVRVVACHSGKSDLQPNELRPVRIPLFVEPVGIDQSRGVVVRIGEDRPQKGGISGDVEHLSHSTLWWASTRSLLTGWQSAEPSEISIPCPP